jgi:hypothetical protein
MNIKDVEIDWALLREKYPSDTAFNELQLIFDRQRDLMETYHGIEQRNGALVVEPAHFGNLDARVVQWRIKDMAYRCIEELSEATNTLKNKPWKNDEVATDKDHFYEELADAFHFFVELCITAGLDASDLFKLYFLKSEVNKFRQRSNY